MSAISPVALPADALGAASNGPAPVASAQGARAPVSSEGKPEGFKPELQRVSTERGEEEEGRSDGHPRGRSKNAKKQDRSDLALAPVATPQVVNPAKPLLISMWSLKTPEQIKTPVAALTSKPEGPVSTDGPPLPVTPLLERSLRSIAVRTAPDAPVLSAGAPAILRPGGSEASKSTGIPAGPLAAIAFAARLSQKRPTEPVAESVEETPAQTHDETQPSVVRNKTAAEPQVASLKAILATPSASDERERAAGNQKLPALSSRPETSAHVAVSPEFNTSHSTPRAPLATEAVVAPGRIEAPDLKPAPASSPHDIRVRIPDERGGATEVRFQNTGADVRVSVRTADAELAHTLRAGLSDLTQRLADNGIQTELWRPGSEQSFSQGGSSHQFLDSNDSGRGGNPYQDAQQDEHQRNRPQWVEELEASTGASRPQ